MAQANPPREGFPKVTVVGAGNVGATAAQLLLSRNIANVALLDVAEGLATGKALDLMQMRANDHFGPTVIGGSDYADSANSDIVVITAGLARKPGMTREDLIIVNSGIVESVLQAALPASPNAIYIIVTNPLDVMTNLAAQLAALPPARLMGMGGILDSARFAYAISEVTGADPANIKAMVIGAHGEAMVPLPSLATVDGLPLASVFKRPQEQIAQIVEATVQGGAAIVELLQTGSAFYAPAASIVRMIEAILGDKHELLSVCAPLSGQYDIDGLYMCAPVRLGAAGIEQVVELSLAPEELQSLRASAASIKAQLP